MDCRDPPVCSGCDQEHRSEWGDPALRLPALKVVLWSAGLCESPFQEFDWLIEPITVPLSPQDLGLIGRDLDRMVIVENTPDCVRGFENNGILVPDYEGGEAPDNTLLIVKKIIQDISESHMTVSEFIAQCPLLTKRWVPTEYGDNIPCYVVDPRAFSYQQPKVNRDLAKYQAQQQTTALPALR